MANRQRSEEEGEGQTTPSILMLTADRRIDRRILLEAETLEAMGMRVTILAMPYEEARERDDRRVVRVRKEEVGRRRESLVVDLYRWVRQRMAMNGPGMLWLKRIAWRWVVRPEDFYLQLFWRAATRYQPDVVVAHDLPMLPVGVRVAQRCGAKVVYDSHELYVEQEYTEREKRAWRQLEEKYIHQADAVITVNRSIAEELMRRYGLSQVEVLLNAERREPQPGKGGELHERFGLPATRKVLLLQGGMTAGRNLETLVRAMRQVRNKEVVLVLLGEGVLRQRLEQIVKRLGLRDRVFWGSLPETAERRTLTASADGGIIPYQAECLNNYYCSPNKLFEYLGAGLPILATDLPELRRFVSGYGIGLLGDTSTPTSMAEMIDDFFGNENRLSDWREQVKTIRNIVNWEVEEKKLKEIYRQVMGIAEMGVNRPSM
jgi:glycosyltransferase involved in cell wall biosynthesis